MTRLIKFLAFLAILLAIAYVVLINWPSASVSSMEVVEELSAEQLYQAYSSDEEIAQGKYFGNAVVVNGVISDKYEDENGASVVILGPDEEPYTLVTLEENESDKLSSYEIGDKIKIKALCAGILMEVVLNKGQIL